MSPRDTGRTSLVARAALLFIGVYGVTMTLLWLLVEPSAVSSADVIWVVIGAGLVGLLAALWSAMRMSRSVDALAGHVREIAEGSTALPRTGISEMDGLAAAITQLHDDGRGRLAAAERASSTLEVVLGALPQGTILVDADDTVAYANPSAYQLLGVIPDSLSGLAPFPFQSAVRECRESRSQVTRTVEHGRPARILMAVATPFVDDDRALLVVVDVTDRERASAVRRDFVANASHELKTPVSSIIASAEALKIAVARGDDSSARFAKQIEESAHQLDRLVVDLLDLSRLERDRPELEPVGLDLLVREEIERIRPLAEGQEIAVGAETGPVRVAGSRRDLVIAVRNLLDNAIRYTGAGGSIQVRLMKQEGEAILEIEDTGEGIPTRDLSRVFERFYRVDNARSRATGGTGLGLAIVKHVVESHGGRVEARSQLGVGSTFTVALPLLEQETQVPS